VTVGPAGVAALDVAAGADLSSAAVTVAASGTALVRGGGTLRLGHLAIDPAGRLEIGSARVEVAAGGFDAASVRSAVGGAGSSGVGITSAAVEAARASGQPRAIGWRADDSGLALRVVAPGDTNLDGLVDIIDAAALLAAGRFDAGGPASWGDGDFNADGGFDILDVSDLVAAELFDRGAYDAGGPATAVAVPEPALPLAGSAAAAVACLAAARIRRRISLTAARSRRLITLAAA